MQALSIWPSKVDFIEVSHLTFRPGASSSRRILKRSSTNFAISNSVSFKGDCCLFASKYLLRIGNDANHRSSKFDLLVGYFPCHSKTQIFLYGGYRSSAGMHFSLGLALEDQAIRGDASQETPGQIIGNVRDNEMPSNEIVSTDDNSRVEITLNGESEAEHKGRVDVRSLAQRLRLAQSAEDVEKVLKNMDSLPLQVFSSIIRGFGREKRLEPAMAIVHWLKEKHEENDSFECPNVFIYNSLLGAVKQCGQVDQIETIMNDMQEVGISPNVVTYNTLMGIYVDQGREDEALKIFEDIQHKGISPSPASYTTSLLAYRRLDDGFGALKLFVSLREKYVRGELKNNDSKDWEIEFGKLKNFTHRICYEVMRRWLGRDGNLSTSVLKLLMEMDMVDLPLPREDCERLVWACSREEHFPVAKELYIRMRERYSDISLSVCNHIIWLMGKAKKWWAALEVYEDLMDEGPKPNNLTHELIVSHFNVLLNAAKKRGIWRWGVQLLNKMEEKGLKPGSREWNSVLIACSKASETATAIEIFKRMIENGEKPTMVSYGALLSALEKGKLYEEAIRVWEHMLKVGVEPNLYTYTIMASVYIGLGKFHFVDYIIKEMVSTGNNPTVVTFNAIISVCARNGSGGTAYEWFQRMKAMSIDPNETSYEMLIEALTKDGKPRLAYDLYLRALNEGLNPSAEAYDAVIQTSQTFGATIDTNALGPRPPERKRTLIKNLPVSSGGIADDSSRSEPFGNGRTSFGQQAGNNL